MSAWLGSIGNLIRLRATDSISQPSGGIGYTTRELTTGGRDAQLVVSRRSWPVSSAIAAPENLNAVQAFQLGGFGRGPWYWVSPDMVATNLVSPWDSIRGQSTHALCPAAPTGYAGAAGAVMPDGVVVPGTLVRTDDSAPTPTLTTATIPLNPDDNWVTVSAYLQGQGARVLVVWRLIDGTSAGTSTGSPIVGSGIQRSVFSGPAPAGAVGLQVACDQSATRIAGPCVTWTRSLFPYVTGRGCYSAVLDQMQRSVVLAVPTSANGGRLESSQWQITEVG